jgi:effector-binding domain-containing protein
VSYEIRIETRPEQAAAVVHAVVAADELPEFLGSAFAEVGAALARQSVFPAGPPFGRYQIVEGGFEVEAGFATTGEVAADGRVEPLVLPGGDIAETVHIGAYSDVAAAYTAVAGWLADSGREPAGAPWEMYLDPPDVAEPRTVVCFPCREAREGGG